MLYTLLAIIAVVLFALPCLQVQQSIAFEESGNVQVTSQNVVFRKGPLSFIVGEYRVRRRIARSV